MAWREGKGMGWQGGGGLGNVCMNMIMIIHPEYGSFRRKKEKRKENKSHDSHGASLLFMYSYGQVGRNEQNNHVRVFHTVA